jgi:hypothetical protein
MSTYVPVPLRRQFILMWSRDFGPQDRLARIVRGAVCDQSSEIFRRGSAITSLCDFSISLPNRRSRPSFANTRRVIRSPNQSTSQELTFRVTRESLSARTPRGDATAKVEDGSPFCRARATLPPFYPHFLPTRAGGCQRAPQNRPLGGRPKTSQQIGLKRGGFGLIDG